MLYTLSEPEYEISSNLYVLNTSSPTGGAILGGSGNFRR
jgi:hypothetical protein